MDISVKDVERIHLYLSETTDYPRIMRLELQVTYKEAVLNIGLDSESYVGGLYIINPRGYISLKNSFRNEEVKIVASLRYWRITTGRPFVLEIYSEPLSRSMIHEIDEKLRPDDLEVNWGIGSYCFLEKDYTKGLIPIFVGTDTSHKFTRREFVKDVLERADLLKREFIEVVVEPIDLSYIKEPKLRSALQLLAEKQKILLEAKRIFTVAKTSSEFRGVIDEVRKVIEGLYDLEEILREAYEKLGYIESPDVEAIREASKGMSDAILEKKTGLVGATFTYASRFGIHTQTQQKKPYTPIPNKMEAEFAIQQALIELNYLIKLLHNYSIRT